MHILPLRTKLIPYGWLALAMMLLSYHAHADTLNTQSQYTSIRESDCSTLTGATTKSYTDRDLGVQECPGVSGWKVYAVASDARSWLDIAKGDRIWSSEQQVVQQNPFGHFPNLGAEKLEWRLDKNGHASGLIFRISAQDPNNAKQTRSRLFAFSLSQDAPTFCGVAQTNDEARKLLSDPQRCRDELKILR